jgi:Protein of unknown function (DUF2384)
MDAARRRRVQPLAPSKSSNPQQRRDPAIRRELSGPALRTFFNIARAWQLSVDHERALLGWPPPSTFHKYKSGDTGTLAFDTLTRLSLVLGIYKSLQVLYPEPAFADGWMQMPNSHALFGGRSPIEFVAAGDVDALFQVRRLLDGRRG